ncbi:MAG TPA: hypothetical protein VGH28_05500 [Polyangiaceae bacterium]|jgi:hypothetical protein
MRARLTFLIVVAVATAGCAARLVVDPGGDGGADAKALSDVDHGDAPFCDDDAGLEPGYCPPGWRCDLWQGAQYVWNVCCAPGQEAGEACLYPSP